MTPQMLSQPQKLNKLTCKLYLGNGALTWEGPCRLDLFFAFVNLRPSEKHAEFQLKYLHSCLPGRLELACFYLAVSMKSQCGVNLCLHLLSSPCIS